MIAAMAKGGGELSVTSVPDPAPGDSDVIVAVEACGLCGTDLHLIDSELPYSPYPVIPGHEFYGYVVETGTQVSSLKAGDLVAVDPNLPCGRCEFCREARVNLCTNYAALGVTTNGAAAEFVRVPASNCWRLPDGFDPDLAVFVEPMSCAIHGFDLLPRRSGDRYLIYGAGTMGLLMAGLAADNAAAEVCVVDTNPDRLSVPAALGFRVATAASEFGDEPRWHTVIDCTGSVAAIEDGLARTRAGGVFQVFGVAPAGAIAAFSPFELYRREISIVGSMAVLHSFDRAIDVLTSWSTERVGGVSRAFDLAQYSQAIETFRSGSSYKIIVRSGDR